MTESVLDTLRRIVLDYLDEQPLKSVKIEISKLRIVVEYELAEEKEPEQ